MSPRDDFYSNSYDSYGNHYPDNPSFQSGVAPVSDNIERIALNNVNFLVFEGGGGKGVVFLGAAKALEQLGLLQRSNGRLSPQGPIQGVAGSSAGAITAVLLSCGYSAAEIERILLGGYNFNRFFDLATPQGMVPTPTTPQARPHARALNQYFSLVPSVVFRTIVGYFDRGGTPETPIVDKLKTPRLVLYMANFIRHYGLASGIASQAFFEQAIGRKAAALRGGNWQRYRHLTFAQHREIFGVDLRLTGSNLSTGKTEIFSAQTSPYFPVAAAARISMSLPVVFKPMIISATMARAMAQRRHSDDRYIRAYDLQGVWVDGGYYNNLPSNAFYDHQNNNARTLNFSLSDYGSGRNRISNIGDYLGVLATALGGLGETQSSRSTGVSGNTIDLVAGDAQYKIGTTTFNFPPEDHVHVRRLAEVARVQTRRYFGR